MKISVDLEKLFAAINVVNLKKIALVVLGGFFIFDPRFRAWVRDQATTYIIALATALIIATPLLFIGILVPDRTVSSLALLFVIIIFLLSWFPTGSVNAALNPTSNDIFPVTIRRIAGWLAFLGWLGVIHNEWLTYWFVVIGIFLFFIFTAFRPGKNSDGLVITFVSIMTIWAIWVWAEPDSNRAFSRLVNSYVGLTVTEADRSSLRNEADSKATYARLLKDVKVAYKATLEEDIIIKMWDVNVSLDKNLTFLIVSQKKEAYLFDGQPFIQIKLPKANGSFIGGEKLWIDADLVMIGSREDVDGGFGYGSRRDDRKPATVQSQPQISPSKSSGTDEPIVLYPGVYRYTLKAGQRTPWFTTPDCSKYHINTRSETYNQRLYFSDGTDCMDGPTVNVADKYGANMQILAYVDEVVTVTVTAASS